MSKARQITSEPVLYLMASVMALGAGLSMLFTADTRWMDWHLSRLGEGGQPSAIIFNIAAGLCALLMGMFAHRLIDDISKVKAPRHSIRRTEALLGAGLWLIAVCMMGIAVFPFDTFPIIHNVFGYGMTLTFVTLILATPHVLPLFSRRFKVVTYSFTTCIAALFVFYFATNGAGIHLLYIEMLALTYFYAWAITVVHVICQNSTVFTAKLQTRT